MKVILSDYYGRDYFNESVVFSNLTMEAAEKEADRLNASEECTSRDYYVVVPDDYKLSEGFVP